VSATLRRVLASPLAAGWRARAAAWRNPGPMRLWAHRGVSAHLPENTVAALAAARAAGADGVELDVRLGADGEVVVFHDDDLRRLAGQPGRIEDLSRAARAAVRIAGVHPVPTLIEALEACAPLAVNVELKTTRPGQGGRLAAAVAALCDRPGLRERILVSSFDPIALAQLRWHAPRLATAYLFHRDQWAPLRRGWPTLAIGASAVHPDDALVTPARVDAWHALGLAVQVWTVDDPDRLRQLAAWGVDGVFTNDPAAARAALRRAVDAG